MTLQATTEAVRARPMEILRPEKIQGMQEGRDLKI